MLHCFTVNQTKQLGAMIVHDCKIIFLIKHKSFCKRKKPNTCQQQKIMCLSSFGNTLGQTHLCRPVKKKEVVLGSACHELRQLW